MKFEFIKKVPIVEIGGKRCFLDTGFPHASTPAPAATSTSGADRPQMAPAATTARPTSMRRESGNNYQRRS